MASYEYIIAPPDGKLETDRKIALFTFIVECMKKNQG